MELAAFPPLLFATPLLLFRSLSSRFASFSLIFGQRVSRYTRNNVFHSFSGNVTNNAYTTLHRNPPHLELARLSFSLSLSLAWIAVLYRREHASPHQLTEGGEKCMEKWARPDKIGARYFA